MTERIFTRAELEEYDGRDGGEAFVAYRGKVYDVTDSTMWVDGGHEAEHEAGRDLTEEMDEAPHGEDVMDEFPVVGLLQD